MRKYISFNIGELLFGLDILLIKEINTKLEITPVYHVAEYVIGMSNLRGQVITILDLNRRLNLTDTERRDRGKIIVVKTEDEISHHLRTGQLNDHSTADKVGLMVDEIGDVVEIADDSIQPPPANFKQLETRFIKGIHQSKVYDSLQVILNLETCLSLDSTAGQYKQEFINEQ